tara:strand:- start:8559 stop:8744 length:186 start_codon:yes stop_codon:yes gene_type:complete
MEEAATLLGYTVAKVDRLRLERQIGFIPGKPIMITREDLDDYVAREQAKAEFNRRYKPRFL